MKTGAELLAEAKTHVREIPVSEAMTLHATGDAVFLDVREPNEWNLGRIPSAVFIPRGRLESDVETRVPRESRVVVYCANANRSAFAANTLAQMGYSDVVSMTPGWNGWVASGGAVES